MGNRAAAAHATLPSLGRRILSSCDLESEMGADFSEPHTPDPFGSAQPVFHVLELWWGFCVLGAILLKVPLLLRISFVLRSPYFPGVHLAGDCPLPPPTMEVSDAAATAICYHKVPEHFAKDW